MANCEFCGKEVDIIEKSKGKCLNEGIYCDECKNKEINELFEEILEDDEDEETSDEEEE